LLIEEGAFQTRYAINFYIFSVCFSI